MRTLCCENWTGQLIEYIDFQMSYIELQMSLKSRGELDSCMLVTKVCIKNFEKNLLKDNNSCMAANCFYSLQVSKENIYNKQCKSLGTLMTIPTLY